MPTDRPELVACAAIRLRSGLIVAGRRHPDCLAMLAVFNPAKADRTQGFMTTCGRFVDRIEARKIQDAAGIPSASPDGYRGDALFSEDLY